ncbi:MurR/RpiR family transcriptional regulator [Carnobacterium maltaromaticum]|uniref:MurR/RpiR family transcriptional regulator n=1 Tax=Carnobacterium maltaromaticum TaxID=2751 RepID=UPI00191BB434|nr:MurR/RpiR family transcriptional regulator [Carnobacterium maltaromaticum]CAD5901387.1 Helix-turn-helix domain, rpiR family protein [Carnobacterium maltaromaticum]
MNVLLKLKNLKHLTTSETVLVNFILASPEKVIYFSPKELAEASFVSISTIYRLINKLKLDGLNDLKLELVKYLNAHTSETIIDINYPISSEDNNYAVMKNLQTVYDQTVQATIATNDLENLMCTSILLQEAEVIDVYTTSANLYFAENFKFQMQEIGKTVHVPKDNYTQNLTAANSTKQHLAIVVSFEGRGTNIPQLFAILKKNNCKILLITAENSPLLSEKVDSHFLFPSLESHYHKISSFSTRTSLMYIFDILYLSYFNKDYDKNIAYKLENYKKMNPDLI